MATAGLSEPRVTGEVATFPELRVCPSPAFLETRSLYVERYHKLVTGMAALWAGPGGQL